MGRGKGRGGIAVGVDDVKRRDSMAQSTILYDYLDNDNIYDFEALPVYSRFILMENLNR